jgi:microcystin-dependent protein
MADPFVAEIRMFSFNFAPKGWAGCNGQLMPISQNTALFSLLGVIYGGDGRSTFGLPNLQGNAPMFYEQGPGLSNHTIGESGGTESVTLLQSEMPIHSHPVNAAIIDIADSNIPTGNNIGKATTKVFNNLANGSLVQMNTQTISNMGGSMPHNNMMPYLVLNFCIALQGIFPPRG